jgi:FixJ family two-component response regulator
VSRKGLVYVVDDDESMREGASSLIRWAGYDVREFASADDFLATARPNTSSCLVCDVSMPGLSGLDLQRVLLESGEYLPIIFITGRGDIPTTVRAMKAGAVEFLSKPFDAEALLDAIGNAVEADSSRRTASEKRSEIQALWNTLTPRERQVATSILGGKLNKQVAAELGVSEITVKIHRRNALRKMRASSVIALSRLIEPLRLPD